MAGRCRRTDDANVVVKALEARFRKHVDPIKLFGLQSPYSLFDFSKKVDGLLILIHIVFNCRALIRNQVCDRFCSCCLDTKHATISRFTEPIDKL